jgi:hypothetical protein
MKNAVFWDVMPCGSCKDQHSSESLFLQEPHGLTYCAAGSFAASNHRHKHTRDDKQINANNNNNYYYNNEKLFSFKNWILNN